MRKELEIEGKYLKPLLKKITNSTFEEWYEIVVYMLEHNEELFVHESTTIQVYHDEDLYQICIVER